MPENHGRLETPRAPTRLNQTTPFEFLRRILRICLNWEEKGSRGCLDGQLVNEGWLRLGELK